MPMTKPPSAPRPARSGESFGPLTGLFDEFFSPSFWPSQQDNASLAPRVDIVDCKDHYLIKAELPGVKKEDINITVHEDVLTLQATTRFEHEETDKEHNIVRQERRYGDFLRRFVLRDNITQSDIRADYTDGILTLTLPKSVPEKPHPTKVHIS